MSSNAFRAGVSAYLAGKIGDSTKLNGFEKFLALGAVGAAVAKSAGGETHYGFWSAAMGSISIPGLTQTQSYVFGVLYAGAVSEATGGKFKYGVLSGVVGLAINGMRYGGGNHWPVPGHNELNIKDKPGEGHGWFNAPRDSALGFHNGIDIEAPIGSDVVAMANGLVVDIQPNPSESYGQQVVLDHGNGLFTAYAHLNSINVSPGDFVVGGSVIGTVGVTGNPPPAGDSHLHFEIRVGSPLPVSAGGSVIEPYWLLR